MNDDEMDQDEAEELIQDPSLKLHAKSLRKVLEMSDVVIEVLDARDPVGTRCRAVERELKALDGGRKKLVLVLNKIGTSLPSSASSDHVHFMLTRCHEQISFLPKLSRLGSPTSVSKLPQSPSNLRLNSNAIISLPLPPPPLNPPPDPLRSPFSS